MAQTSWRPPPFALSEHDLRFMQTLEDDPEEAPWMVMGDLQFWSATGFAHSLRNYARAHRLGWFVAAIHPIEYPWPDATGRLVRKVLELVCQIITPRAVRLHRAARPRQEAIEAVALPPAPTHHSRRPRLAIPPERWPLVGADARVLGLRQAARQHGVSHETVRQIVRRVAGMGVTA